MDTFLVIGGAGFIGSNLVRYLVDERKCEVIVFHRKDSNLTNLQGISFKSVEGDLLDMVNLENKLCKALENCKGVFNLAAYTNMSNSRKYDRLRKVINIDAAQIIARVARKTGVRLVHISSSTALGISKRDEIINENYKFNVSYDSYGLTKHFGENVVIDEVKRGLDAVIAIPCSTFGAGAIKGHQLDLFRNIAGGKMRMYPPGGLCLTSVDDLVRGIVLCYEKGRKGQKYILGGHNIKYKQYFDAIAVATNGRSPIIRLPAMIMPWLGLGVEVVCNILRKETNVTKNVAKMICKNLYYSSDLAVSELGYEITDWKVNINRTVNQLRNEGKIGVKC